MDALKRAEASKQQAGQSASPEPAAETTGLSLEPLGAGNGERGQALPDLAAHLDAVDADLEASASMAQAAPRPAPAGPSSAPPSFVASASSRDAARAMFAAKAPPPPSHAGLWLTLGALGVCGIGIGLYFWWQLSHLNGSSLRPAAPAAQITRMTPAPAPGTPGAPPPVPVPQPSATVLEQKPAASEDAYAASERAAAASKLARGRIAAPELQPEPEVAPNAPRLQLTRTRPAADPLLLRGWQNLQAGNIDAARKDYEQSLRGDPKNVDALLGLAVIASRQGRSADAEHYFMQALEADPKDAAAQAAIFGLRAQSDPSVAESRLKLALSEQPESPSLNFTLGNLYAREQRWNEAQQAYFNAVSGDGSNPDYLFNLAVSLDQMRQPKLAAQYYQKALEANSKRPAAFDAERVRRRLNQLTTTP